MGTVLENRPTVRWLGLFIRVIRAIRGQLTFRRCLNVRGLSLTADCIDARVVSEGDEIGIWLELGSKNAGIGVGGEPDGRA